MSNNQFKLFEIIIISSSLVIRSCFYFEDTFFQLENISIISTDLVTMTWQIIYRKERSQRSSFPAK